MKYSEQELIPSASALKFMDVTAERLEALLHQIHETGGHVVAIDVTGTASYCVCWIDAQEEGQK